MNNKFRNNFLYLFFIFAFFNFINLSNALIISEIMYDPNGSDNIVSPEYVELYNDENNPINVADYKLLYGTTKQLSLSEINNSTNPTLNTGEYAVILFSTNDIFKNICNSKCLLIKTDTATQAPGSELTAYSATSTAKPIKLYKNNNLIFSANYYKETLSSDNGNSLNNLYNISTTTFNNNVNNNNIPLWYSFVASPGATTTGATTTSSGSVGESQSPSEANASSYYTSGYYSRTYTIGDMRVIVPKDIYGIAGGETYFPSIIMNSKKEILKGDFLWSFGDGSSLATSTPKYIYKNPGEYIATIEAQQSGTSLYGIERVIVHIVAPDIIISDYVNEEKNIPFWRQDNKGYIELYNRSNEEVNIGGFYIEGGGGNYQLSKFFIIPAHSKVKIYNNILNLQTLDNPKLLFPNRLVLYDWNDNHNLITATTTPIYVLSNNNSKNISTTDIISSTSTTIISTTTSTTTQGNIQSINKSINKITQNNIRPKAQSKTNDTNIDNINNVDKPSIPFYKKLLYFLYE